METNGDGEKDGRAAAGTRPPLFKIHEASVVRGGKTILHVGDFSLAEGEHVALLGPNGAGKSTFIQLLTREVFPVWREEPPVLFRGAARPELDEIKRTLGIVSSTMHDQVRVHLPVIDIVVGGLFGTLGVPLRGEVGERDRALALLVPGRHVACDAVNAPSGHGAAQKASTKDRAHTLERRVEPGGQIAWTRFCDGFHDDMGGAHALWIPMVEPFGQQGDRRCVLDTAGAERRGELARVLSKDRHVTCWTRACGLVDGAERQAIGRKRCYAEPWESVLAKEHVPLDEDAMRRHNSNITDAIHADRSIGALVGNAPHKCVAVLFEPHAKLLDLRQVQRLEPVRRNRLAFEIVPTSRSRTPRPLPR